VWKIANSGNFFFKLNQKIQRSYLKIFKFHVGFAYSFLPFWPKTTISHCRMMPNYTMLGILQQLTSVAALSHGG